MISLVNEIKKIVPAQPTPESLEEFLVQAEKYSQDSEFEFDIGSVKEFSRLLNEMYVKNSAVFRSVPDLEQRMRGLLVKLAWTNPLALDGKEKNDLIAAHLVSSIRAGLDPLATIKKWLEFYQPDGDSPDAGRISQILNLLVINEERIGQTKIHLKTGEEVGPVVKNWIRDYISYNDVNRSRADSYVIARYFSDSPNVKQLSTEEREVLSQVLRIYNYLKQTRNVSEIAAQQDKSQPGSKVFSKPASNNLPIAPSVAPVLPKTIPLSAVNNHGASLDLLKSRLEKTPSVAPSRPSSSEVKMTPQEIEREVDTIELPSHSFEVPSAPVVPMAAPKPKQLAAKVETINFAPKPKPGSIPFAKPLEITNIKPPVAAPTVPKPATVNVVDDLKKLNLDYLRSGSLHSQINTLRSQIMHLSEANNMLPYHVVLAFEESPLFKAYLSQGSAKIGGQVDVSSGLTHEEFEALADLRKEIESL